MDTLFLFVDEAGNFDFSPNGTKFFILNVLSTLDPFELATSLLKLRYDLIKENTCGTHLEEEGFFHASEDTQAVRDKVFDILANPSQTIRVDSIISQKNKLNPACYKNHREFYEILAKPLLKYAFNRAVWRNYEKVVVVFSSLFDKSKRGIMKQSFKSLIKTQARVPFSIYFHNSKFDLCSQAVDYYS